MTSPLGGPGHPPSSQKFSKRTIIVTIGQAPQLKLDDVIGAGQLRHGAIRSHSDSSSSLGRVPNHNPKVEEGFLI